METLDQLMYWRGIASDYFDYKGEKVEVSLDNRKLLLRAMGLNPDDEAEIKQSTYALDVGPWTHWLQGMQVIQQYKECCFFLNLHPEELDHEFKFTITLESGETREGRFIPSSQPEVGDYQYESVRYSRRAVMCGALPLGYHRLSLVAQGSQVDDTLTVVPEKGYVPEVLNKGSKPWGVIVQLYTLRSERNWGIGDLADLQQLIKRSSESGIDIIGLNPLHVLCTPNEHHCSPYSPSDRRFIEPLYIAPENVVEYDSVFNVDQQMLAELRAVDQVDYQGVWAAKYAVYREMFAAFKRNELIHHTLRAQQFTEYVQQEGDALNDYCIYQALRNAGESIGPLNHEPSQKQLQPLSAKQQEDVDFYAYLQWQVQEQMAACQRLAEVQGMTIGLMRDLAVGADGGGSEVSTNLELFCRDASVGAPPDPLAEKGQNWGLPPMDPATLRNSNFEHYICLLRKNMAQCGALRIDHAMSLMRLWWCPPHQTADYGAYVYYSFPEMLGLLKLESIRNRCMIIGEDMGVVPDEFRSAITDGAVFTNKLFYFEREHDHSFRLPQHYMPKALAMLTNHDVPTLVSWWATTDLILRRDLNLLDDTVPFESVIEERNRDKHRLLDWLVACGEVLPAEHDKLVNQPLSYALLASIMQCGAKVASQVFVVQLEDLELIDAPVNVPGTSAEYANWQRKLKSNLDDIFSNPLVSDILEAVTRERA